MWIAGATMDETTIDETQPENIATVGQIFRPVARSNKVKGVASPKVNKRLKSPQIKTEVKKEKTPLTTTPIGRITAMLRKIWMWSPERAAAMKRGAKHCEECGCEGVPTKKDAEKTGKKRLEVHHVIPCDMTELAKLIHKRMFPGVENLDCLCTDCHKVADEVLNREKL